MARFPTACFQNKDKKEHLLEAYKKRIAPAE